MPKINIADIKTRFLEDIADHTMSVEMDNGLYRHLMFTDNGSSVYRFDIHTWPGYLCICGDMGTYVFRRITDMFEFFRLRDNKTFDDKYVINPHYWAEKLEAVNADNARSNSSNGYEEFSPEVFKERIREEYEQFCEDLADDDEENVTEAYPEGTQTRKQQLEDLWTEIEENVISSAHNGPDRAYDAAMSFKWKSEDKEISFDMQDFWESNCNEYTYHYIWILYAIVWGITQYDDSVAIE